MIIRLRYGQGSVTADLRGLRCRELRPHAPRHSKPVSLVVGEALDRPEDGLPLAELAKGRRRVTVLVPDATRKADLPGVLPLVLSRLHKGGIEEDQVTILVACGTHPKASNEELRQLIGHVHSKIRIIQHDSHDEDALVKVGTIGGGVSVRFNRAVMETDLLFSVSTVQHHYFAGFGGGPKLIFPGVAGYAETQLNHSRVIDLSATPPRRHPACEPGVIQGNPVAEEIAAIARLRPPDFALLLVLNDEGKPAYAAGGSLDVAYPIACSRVREWFEVEPERFSRVVVSAGGQPSDTTLIQAHKALDAACRFATDGAEVVFIASCDGGAGSPAAAPFLLNPKPQEIMSKLATSYVQYGHTVLRLIEKTNRYKVLALTHLAEDLVERLGMHRTTNLDGVFDRWRDEAHGEGVGVMPGPVVYPAKIS